VAWHNGDGLDEEEARQTGPVVAALGERPRGSANARLGARLSGVDVPVRRNYAGLQCRK
jgi:hypothetical protein